MREYKTDAYKKSLEGSIFHTTDSELKELDGLKVKKVIRELSDNEYDRELIDDSDKNEAGKYRYLINCMYEIELENGKIIQVFEDEINQEYSGDWEN